MSTAIAEVDNTALVSHRAATNAAGICRELAIKKKIRIQGRDYVPIEVWQAIANSFGCVCSSHGVEKIDGGIRATGQVKRVEDGLVIAEAEGFVGEDEPTWSSRPEYARRAMAQTRAMSRAARSAFAHVVTLMDAGLETTPAEEMVHLEAAPVEVRPKFEREQSGFQRAIKAISEATSAETLDRVRAHIPAALELGNITEDEMQWLHNRIENRMDELGIN